MLLYLHPFGSTQPENIEIIMADRPDLCRHNRGPVILCYDQEPLLPSFNKNLFDSLNDRWEGPFILLNTEQVSEAKNKILRTHNMVDANYFYHGLCAADWYRGYRYDARITKPSQRKINKTFVTLNRITSGERVYRIIFVASLLKAGLRDSGIISFSDMCAQTGKNAFVELHEYGLNNNLDTTELTVALASANLPMRFDTDANTSIPNGSHVLGPVDKFMECAFFIVTETCFWDKKTHLTEKTIKPIVMKMPFVLLGAAHNLKYLKSYGFKTFDRWIDESYDDIEDPIARIEAVVKIIEYLNTVDLEQMLSEMEPVLEHNYKLFYSEEFVNLVWSELTSSLKQAAIQAGVPLLPQKP